MSIEEFSPRDYSRREMMRLSALLTAAGALPLLKSFEARAETFDAPLRIGYLPITDATPLLVAHGKGFFEEQGIKAEKPVRLRSWAQVLEAFISGQVNAVHLLSPMTVWARFGSKAPAKVVAWNHTSGSGLSVPPHIDSVKDLGGTTVAIPFWYSIHNVVLQILLRENGLIPVSKRSGAPAPNEVNLIVMAPADMVPALAAKQITGYIVAEPFNAASEVLGVGKMLRFTGDVWKDHACCLVFMHERDIQQRPEWVQRAVNAMVKAQLWTRDHRAETAALLAKDNPNQYTPHSVEVLTKVLAPPESDDAFYLKAGAIKHPEWRERRIDFQPYPYPSYTEELIRRLRTTLVEGERGFLDTLDPVAAGGELVDDSFVRKAVIAAGGMTAFGLPDSFTRTEVVAA